MLLNDQIEWWEPTHASRKKALAELKASGLLLSPKQWIRVMLMAIRVVAPLIAWGMWAVPGTELPWASMFIDLLFMCVALAVALLAMAAMSVLIPQRISVSRDSIDLAGGQNARIERSWIDRIEIVEREADERRLVIEYSAGRGHAAKRSVVIAESVDIASLRALVQHLAPCKSLEPADARFSAVHAAA